MKTLILIPILALCSCTGAIHGITKTPVPFSKVKKIDGSGPEIKVADADLYRAGQYPDDIYGFYSVSRVSAVVGKSSK